MVVTEQGRQAACGRRPRAPGVGLYAPGRMPPSRGSRRRTGRAGAARRPCLRRGRERVVVVVPALAERHERDDPVVAALVLDLERPLAVHVADRVHAPRRVVQQEDADEAAPDERGERRRRACRRRARRRPRTGCARPSSAQTGNQRSTTDDRGVLAQVAGEAPGRRALVTVEQPARVRVPPARSARRASRAPPCGWGLCGSPSSSVNVWCLRWSATQWMTAPCTDIEPRIASVARTARRRVERAVGEQAMEADRDAEADEHVHDGEDREVEAGHERRPTAGRWRRGSRGRAGRRRRSVIRRSSALML